MYIVFFLLLFICTWDKTLTYFHIGNNVNNIEESPLFLFICLFVYFGDVVIFFLRVNRAEAKPRHLPQSCFFPSCFILKEENKTLLNTKEGAASDIY